MPNSSIATGSFSSRKEANLAVQRLLANGFARNSIELHRDEDGDGYEVEIHTRRENLRRAERLIHAGEPLYVVRQTASGALETARSYPLILLGAGVLAGFLIYNLLPREDGAHTSRQRGRRTR